MSRGDLIGLGFGPRSIEYRLAKGRLHPVMRGVYAVGWPEMTRERRWMAAILRCGTGAVLSHGSAAASWDLLADLPGIVELTSSERTERDPPGIKVRVRRRLMKDDKTIRNSIPTTTPARTLLDLAEVRPAVFERAVNEADKRELIDPEALRESLARYRRQPGVAVLRRLLDRDTFRLSDSELEIRFRRITTEAGLPTPLTKVFVGGFEVDFFWPQLGLVVETDGLRYHRTATSQTRDRLRDQTHVAAGLTTLRFTDRQVRFEPSHVTNILMLAAARLRPE